MTRKELEFVINEYSVYVFPLITLITAVHIKRDGKVKTYTKSNIVKAIRDFNSSPNVEIHFDFIDDLYIKANSFAFDLLYLR